MIYHRFHHGTNVNSIKNVIYHAISIVIIKFYLQEFLYLINFNLCRAFQVMTFYIIFTKFTGVYSIKILKKKFGLNLIKIYSENQYEFVKDKKMITLILLILQKFQQ